MNSKSDLITGLENLAKSAVGKHNLAELACMLPIEAREKYIAQDHIQLGYLISPHNLATNEIEVVCLYSGQIAENLPNTLSG